MKRFLTLFLVVLCLAGCSAESLTAAPSAYEVIPQRDQSQALAANDALLDAYDWDGTLENVDVMPKDYAGRYIDEDNVLNILTVAPLADVLETYTEACGTKNIRLQQAEFSYFDLNEAMDALDEYNESNEPMLCYSWGIDEIDNRINIIVSRDMEDAAKAMQEQYPCIRYQVEEPELEVADHSMYTEIEEVTLEIIEQTDEKAIYQLVNNSDLEVFFARPNKLEVLVDDVWLSVPYRSDIAFTEELLGVVPGGTGENSVWFAARSYEFVPGIYRIGQTYALGEYEPLQGKDFDHIAYVTFTVE